MRPMRLLTGFCVVLETGCAGSMASLTGGDVDSPAWYKERVAEVSGTAYPELSKVPGLVNYGQTNQAFDASILNEAELRARFLANPRSQPAYLTPSEIRAWGQALKRQVNSRNAPADFLTDEDVAELRARFDRPRARR